MGRTTRTFRVDAATEYLKNPAYKDMPRLKLARILKQEHPLTFKSVDDARNTLKYLAGKAGTQKRKDLGLNIEFIENDDRPKNPYALPQSDETVYEPFILSGHKRIAGLFDIHVPYHSMTALTAVIDFLKKDKPDGVILGGDFWDFFQLSRFLRDPRKRHFAAELNDGTQIMQIIQKALNCQIYFKFGNHEERYDHFLFQKAKELVGVEEFALEEMIKKRMPGIQIIKDKRIIKAGGLNIIHGHEYTQGIFNPVNVARGLFLRGKTSALQGHSHQTSEHTESDMNGKITTTWSAGCLCELHPDYAPLNKWNHGFCIIDVDNNQFDVRNKRILNGKVL